MFIQTLTMTARLIIKPNGTIHLMSVMLMEGESATESNIVTLAHPKTGIFFGNDTDEKAFRRDI